MQFKHPEILYFLFLLVIPILVHLFQLRKFKKEYFTNVKLLRELQLQTRKSSTIKKWLLLAARLLLLTALIFAFAQPFKKAKDQAAQNNELILLVDNSFSMQAKGAEGELLKKSIQDILEHIPENQQVSIVTPSESYWDINPKTILKELQNLPYTFYSFHPDYLLAQAENKKPNTAKDYIVISDAQNVTSEKIDALAKKRNCTEFSLKPKTKAIVALIRSKFQVFPIRFTKSPLVFLNLEPSKMTFFFLLLAMPMKLLPNQRFLLKKAKTNRT